MFGEIFGRFFLGPHLGEVSVPNQDVCTLSELVETWEIWPQFVKQVPHKKKQLYTMFETSDVHPDIINAMRCFDVVIVPMPFLRDILVKHGVNAISTNFYTSDIIRSKPWVIPKERNPNKLVYLYVGTNDMRKNVTALTKTFAKAAEGTEHILIVKTNKPDDLTLSKNIRIITEKISIEKLVSLYNMCDYVITFTNGEGVGLPMLEADYFRKPVIASNVGVFKDVKTHVTVPWHVLPSKEVEIDISKAPDFLKKVFYKTWWEVDESEALKVIQGTMPQVLH
tara:strand:+ start:1373 stop:2215 length:843 start_codon:yes stop_codon:yes gene_type:complete